MAGTSGIIMRRLAQAIFFLGFFLILGAALIAFETYISEDKRSASRDNINTWLDEKNAEYEQAREDGCRRRCGALGSLSRVIISFRDVFSCLCRLIRIRLCRMRPRDGSNLSTTLKELRLSLVKRWKRPLFRRPPKTEFCYHLRTLPKHPDQGRSPSILRTTNPFSWRSKHRAKVSAQR